MLQGRENSISSALVDCLWPHCTSASCCRRKTRRNHFTFFLLLFLFVKCLHVTDNDGAEEIWQALHTSYIDMTFKRVLGNRMKGVKVHRGWQQRCKSLKIKLQNKINNKQKTWHDLAGLTYFHCEILWTLHFMKVTKHDIRGRYKGLTTIWIYLLSILSSSPSSLSPTTFPPFTPTLIAPKTSARAHLTA